MSSGQSYQPLQFEMPPGWVDKSTVVVTPPSDGPKPPTINMVVKRRPVRGDVASTLREYLIYMTKSFGHLEGLMAREMPVGGATGYALKFSAKSAGKKFRQTTLFFLSGNEEVSASVTQLEGDNTSDEIVESMLASIRSETKPPQLW